MQLNAYKLGNDVLTVCFFSPLVPTCAEPECFCFFRAEVHRRTMLFHLQLIAGTLCVGDSSFHGCQPAQPAAYQTAGYSVTADMLNRPLKRNGHQPYRCLTVTHQRASNAGQLDSRWQQWKFRYLRWHYCVSPKHNENLSFQENLGSHAMLWRWQRLLCYVWTPWLFGGQHYGEGLRLATSVCHTWRKMYFQWQCNVVFFTL